MNRLRFYNARILTMAEGEDLYEGELWVENGRIAYTGPGEEKDQMDGFTREIDCEGNLLMPGFKNAHSHSAMTFLRSFADDMPLQEWLHERVFPMEEKLTSKDINTLAKLGILEYLTSGITANFDMYIDNYAHADASTAMGYRTVFCGEMNDFTGSLERTRQEYKDLNSLNPLVSFCLGVHAEYTTSRPLLEGMAELAAEYHAPVYLHLAETEKEVRECRDRYGMSPVKFLDSLGIFNYGGGGFHGVWLDEEDIEICRKRRLSIVTNPASNAKLASGVADLISLEGAGVNLALGTDGPASNNALDMFREMYLAAVLQKLKRRDAAAMDAAKILRMATVGGARAMGLTDCETLEEGQLADLILIDLHRPNMQPENNLVKNLVYSGSKENVKLTMVNGRILYEDGRFFVGEDAEQIYHEANAIVERLMRMAD